MLLTVIPVLAVAHPSAVALLAPLGSLSVIFNVYFDVSPSFNAAVTFTLPFVHPLGLNVNITSPCCKLVTFSVPVLLLTLMFPAASFTHT